MSVYNSIELLKDLHKDVEYILSQHETLLRLPHDNLLLQPAPNRWSIAQVLEHLNAYNRFYLPVFEQALNKKNLPQSNRFKSGILGDYFTKLMLPKDDGSLNKKMNAMKAYIYTPDLDADRVLTDFEVGQQKLIILLNSASHVNIGKIMIPTGISRFMKIKLGDGFRFLIAHQLRHFVQIGNVK